MNIVESIKTKHDASIEGLEQIIKQTEEGAVASQMLSGKTIMASKTLIDIEKRACHAELQDKSKIKLQINYRCECCNREKTAYFREDCVRNTIRCPDCKSKMFAVSKLPDNIQVDKLGSFANIGLLSRAVSVILKEFVDPNCPVETKRAHWWSLKHSNEILQDYVNVIEEWLSQDDIELHLRDSLQNTVDTTKSLIVSINTCLGQQCPF